MRGRHLLALIACMVMLAVAGCGNSLGISDDKPLGSVEKITEIFTDMGLTSVTATSKDDFIGTGTAQALQIYRNQMFCRVVIIEGDEDRVIALEGIFPDKLQKVPCKQYMEKIWEKYSGRPFKNTVLKRGTQFAPAVQGDNFSNDAISCAWRDYGDGFEESAFVLNEFKEKLPW